MVSALVPGSSGPGSSPGLVPANCWGNLTNCWGVTCDGLASRPASCYGNQDKLWPDEPVLAPKASLTFLSTEHSAW